MNKNDDLKELRKLWSGFWPSRVVLTANNFRVFDHLRESRTAAEVADAVCASVRGITILLDALVSLGLLKKSGNAYCNSELSNTFLVAGAPDYQGDMIRHADILWRNWSALDDIVKTGSPASEASHHESFIRAMHNNSRLKAATVVDTLDLAGVRRALDLGGGPGTYSIELARRGSETTLFDLPETVPIAQEIIAEAGVTVELRAGDVFSDSLGEEYDLILMSQLLHAFSPEDNRLILEKCLQSLNSGGRVVIQEFLINDDLTGPPFGALFAVNMLVNTSGGRCYPASELKRLVVEAGFQEATETVIEDSVLVTATAP